MRIREETRFARIWPSASKRGTRVRIDPRESAKPWGANRLPTIRKGLGVHKILGPQNLAFTPQVKEERAQE